MVAVPRCDDLCLQRAHDWRGCIARYTGAGSDSLPGSSGPLCAFLCMVVDPITHGIIACVRCIWEELVWKSSA